MTPGTHKTLYVLVTCCLEASRFEVLKQVVENLNEQNTHHSFNFKKDLIVFDNGSTHPGTDELLTANFPVVIKSEENVGYWSALNWVFKNHDAILDKQYDCVYTIESDLIHYEMWQLEILEDLLLTYMPEVGCIRCEEFEFANRHLYNKDQPSENSRTYAWCRHWNAITNQKVKFAPLVLKDDVVAPSHLIRAVLASGETELDYVMLTNFVPKIPALNRLQTMKDVFDDLANHPGFTEFDFQKYFHQRYQVVGLIDGGIFHSKLSNADRSILSASYTDLAKQAEVGYVNTRTGCTIVDPSTIRVQRLKTSLDLQE